MKKYKVRYIPKDWIVELLSFIVGILGILLLILLNEVIF